MTDKAKYGENHQASARFDVNLVQWGTFSVHGLLRLSGMLMLILTAIT